MPTIALAAPPADPDDRRSLNGRAGRNGQHEYNGCRDLGQKTKAVVDRKMVVPDVDPAAIRAVAIHSGRAGESTVAETALHEFCAANKQHKEELHALLRVLILAIKGVQRRLADISKEMNQTDPYFRCTCNGSPWTTISRVKVAFFIILSAILLLVGINTTATVLKSSGIRMFESTFAAYFFSMIPLALPAALKAAGTFIEDTKKRQTYILIVWALGFLFGTLWAFYFADTFPALTQSPADIVRSLTENGPAGHSLQSNKTFIVVAIMAETFLSAGCWLTAQAIAEKHQLDRHKDNPSYTKLQSDLDDWAKILQEYTQLQGQIEGKLQAFDHEQRRYVDKCLNLFRAALKHADDNRMLGDFLNG